MTNGERYKIFKEWFESVGFPKMHCSYKDALWQGFEAGHSMSSKENEAAPELLEALRQLRDYVEDVCAVSSSDCDKEHPLMLATAAINKALGEKQ